MHYNRDMARNTEGGVRMSIEEDNGVSSWVDMSRDEDTGPGRVSGPVDI